MSLFATAKIRVHAPLGAAVKNQLKIFKSVLFIKIIILNKKLDKRPNKE